MTIVLHGALAALSVSWLRRWWLTAFAAIQGMLPDIIGIFGGSALGNWKIYEWAHQSHWWMFPFGWLHIGTDLFWHAPDGGWHWWGIYAEVLIWLVIIIYFIHKKKG